MRRWHSPSERVPSPGRRAQTVSVVIAVIGLLAVVVLFALLPAM